jgi:hypothetical protein
MRPAQELVNEAIKAAIPYQADAVDLVKAVRIELLNCLIKMIDRNPGQNAQWLLKRALREAKKK